MTCKHDANCRDPFCVEDELGQLCAECGHRLGQHRDKDCRYGACPCTEFESKPEIVIDRKTTRE